MIASTHRPTRIDIHLEAISNNLAAVMALLPKTTKALAVVKANAYGHGAVAVAKHLESGVAGFCVSNIDEALELRQAGITKTILVLGVVPAESVALAKKAGISLTIASLDWLEEAIQSHVDFSGVSYHLKVDTGMGRIGFRDGADVLAAIGQLDEHSAQFDGIFTHFATADERDETQFQSQLSIFKDILACLPYRPRYIHTSNSATALWHPEAVYDLVRLGDVLYGCNPSGHIRDMPIAVTPALSLTSEIVHVKTVPRGSAIGYGATYTSKDAVIIATIPIGYADGLTRDMQGFELLVADKPCSIVGRISMDQTTICLPKMYPIGTPVTLIGKGRTVQDWADYRRSINYEVLCLLSDRIPRYYDKGE